PDLPLIEQERREKEREEHRRRLRPAWRALTTRRLTLILAIFAFLALSGPLSTIRPTLPFFLLGAVGVAALHLGAFRCPSCGKRFHSNGWHHNAFAMKCLSCGVVPDGY